MGVGRPWPALISGRIKVSPRTGRVVPPPNAHARCVGSKLFGKRGGGRNGVRERFTDASKECA